MNKWWWLIGLGCVLAGCGKEVSPQRPAQRGNEKAEPDSSLMRLIELNQRMANEADREVVHYVQADSAHQYAQCTQGAWVCRTAKVEGSEHPKMTESYHAQMKIYTLKSSVVDDFVI